MENIKEKKVALLELFYDLIYVYSISKLTSIIHHPHEGAVSGVTFYKYIIVALIILQAWYFKVENFGINSIIAFGIIVLLFGCYVVNNHNMVNSHQSTRGLVWMYSHFAIITSINLLTVAVDFAVKNDVNFIFLVKLIIVSMLVYYAALFSDSIYYYKNIKLSKNDILLSLLMIVIGIAVIIIGSGNNSFTLLGMFITVCGNFVSLTKKYYSVKHFCNKA